MEQVGLLVQTVNSKFVICHLFKNETFYTEYSLAKKLLAHRDKSNICFQNISGHILKDGTEPK